MLRYNLAFGPSCTATSPIDDPVGLLAQCNSSLKIPLSRVRSYSRCKIIGSYELGERKVFPAFQRRRGGSNPVCLSNERRHQLKPASCDLTCSLSARNVIARRVMSCLKWWGGARVKQTKRRSEGLADRPQVVVLPSYSHFRRTCTFISALQKQSNAW